MIHRLNVGNIHFHIWNGWNSDLHGDISIDAPIFDPLLPQLRVLQIDLKVWAYSSKWCLDGWRRLEGTGRGENFVWVKQGFPNGGSMGGRLSRLTKGNISKTNPTHQIRSPKVCTT